MKTKIHIGALYKHWRNPNTEMILLTADEYFVTVYNVHTQDCTTEIRERLRLTTRVQPHAGRWGDTARVTRAAGHWY